MLGRSNTCKRFASMLAMVAVLLHAFAPSVSHAMMAKSGKSFVEICTSQGFKLVEVDVGAGGDFGKSTPGVKVSHDCAVCAAASAPPSPPSQAMLLDIPALNAGLIAVSSTFVFADALHLFPPPTGPPGSLAV
jgi:hypothetical protein